MRLWGQIVQTDVRKQSGWKTDIKECEERKNKSEGALQCHPLSGLWTWRSETSAVSRWWLGGVSVGLMEDDCAAE